MLGYRIEFMTDASPTIRNIKEMLRALFSSQPLDEVLKAVHSLPQKKVINSLFQFFYESDPKFYWPAITVMGTSVNLLAESHMESARVVMRRLMWNLNEESGGIGWGAAEAMGEIMAQNRRLAEEYSGILIAYINPYGNPIDHPLLQRGILWGVGRLAQHHSDLAQCASEHLIPFLSSPDPYLRGFAVWVDGFIPTPATESLRKSLYGDTEKIILFSNGKLQEIVIGSLAQSFPFVASNSFKGLSP
jgi:hypothetical protein